MLVDNPQLSLGSELINFEMHKGTQAERLALIDLTGGEFFYETDVDVGVWIYSNGSWIKPGLGRLITITGDVGPYTVNSVYNFTISNFNTLSSYTITPTNGQLTLTGASILYTAPASIGTETFSMTKDGASSSATFEIVL